MMFFSFSIAIALVVLGPQRASAGFSQTAGIDAISKDVEVKNLDGIKVEQSSQDSLLFNVSDHATDFMPLLLAWINNQGGLVHESLDFQPRSDNDGTMKVFASEFIPKGTNLLVLPKSALILPSQSNFTSDGGKDCNRHRTARKLYEELQLGPSSKFAPYLQSLVTRGSKAVKGRLPTAVWTAAGQQILEQLLVRDRSSDDKEEEYRGMELDLPPQSFTGGSIRELLDADCGDSAALTSDDVLYAFLLHHRFSWGHDSAMIPIYDMMEHRTGALVNTVLEELGESQEIVLRSSRIILKGEEVFGSHYQHVEENYGTPELFRDYGFVENYPQRFIFHETDVAFVVDQAQTEVGENSITPRLQVKWLSQRPYDEDIEFLNKQHERLSDFFFETRHKEMVALPDTEQNLLRQYHDTLVNAIGAAIEAYQDESNCILSDGCHEYDLLEITPDTLDYQKHTCDTSKVLGFEGYADVDIFQTPYQNVTFFHNAQTKDTCFDLDQTVQICDSYRPAYHEPAVQYPARYLDKLERALFVGGGDSMLLHELLKYESIQKIVGLELDQKVTRYSFKHFGTQPHWDNEKVEWWYGDATKSLAMLPQDYFGSFDLVIVDLSETVMSFRVTDSLDIFGALALLLTPKGILVKNEVYLERFSELFDYSMQAVVYNAPVVCNQVMVFGSYGTDFLQQEPKEDDVETLLLQDHDDFNSPYGIWHDYRKNRTRLHPNCGAPELTQQGALLDQTSSPGIVMIVDVENTSIVAVSPDELTRLLTRTLAKLGLSVVSAMTSEGQDEGGESTTVVFVAMEEGYVMGRAWPTKRLCALDIHLWGAFDKQDRIRKALIGALRVSPEVRTTSAYRIVAGGMYGAKNWQEDTYDRGPPMERNCTSAQESTEIQATSLPNAGTTHAVLSEVMPLANKSDITMTVFCGREDQPCESLQVVSDQVNVRKVVPVWACPDLENVGTETGFGSEVMKDCQAQVLDQLDTDANGGNTLSAIVLDSTVPYAMGQILVKIFSDTFAKEKHLETEDLMVVTTSAHDETSTWRQAVLDRFRHDIIVQDPVFRAEVLIHSEDNDSVLELGVTRSGDSDFILHLKAVLTRIEDQTVNVADVQSIHGGMFSYQDEEAYNPTIFHNDDYDETAPMEQWISQEPMGFQTIFQLEPKHWTDYIKAGDSIDVFFDDGNAGFWDPGHVTEIYRDEGPLFDVALEDGSFASKVHPVYLRAMDRSQISASVMNDALLHALDAIVEGKKKAEDTYQWKSFSNPEMGEGSVSVALWIGGSVTVLWDGRDHIDVNLFTYQESVEMADDFVAHVCQKIPAWTTTLRDEQPRGSGRVVNFQKDLSLNENGERELPHWAHK